MLASTILATWLAFTRGIEDALRLEDDDRPLVAEAVAARLDDGDVAEMPRSASSSLNASRTATRPEA